MNLFFLKHEKKVYLDLKEALLIRREENVLILRRLCTDFQKRRKCTKFEKLMYTFLIKKKILRRREEFKKKMYIPLSWTPFLRENHIVLWEISHFGFQDNNLLLEWMDGY